jgi:hypothetical protein
MENCIPLQYWTEFGNFKLEKDQLNLLELHVLKQMNLKAVSFFDLTYCVASSHLLISGSINSNILKYSLVIIRKYTHIHTKTD